MNVLVTGADGFIGKNLCAYLEQKDSISLAKYTRESSLTDLEDSLIKADFIFHLAGVNRPKEEREFKSGNVELTQTITDHLLKTGRQTPLLITSSVQAEQDNPYGLSKHAAEDVVKQYATSSGAKVYIFRLPNVFGKWCRPNYNSFVATFCHNLTHNLPVKINDASARVDLVYIDDVVYQLLGCLNSSDFSKHEHYCRVDKVQKTTVGSTYERLKELYQMRDSLVVPDLSDQLTKDLYSTLTSYYSEEDYAYSLKANVDERGTLTEFLKSNYAGQIFVSTTRPGFSRGNHWHHSKVEKFSIISGEAEVSFRHIFSEKTFNYRVKGEDTKVIDIPVGYVHAVKNIGKTDMIMLIWANEIFDKSSPDTFYEETILNA